MFVKLANQQAKNKTGGDKNSFLDKKKNPSRVGHSGEFGFGGPGAAPLVKDQTGDYNAIGHWEAATGAKDNSVF